MGKWFQHSGDHSLSEAYESVPVPPRGPGWRRCLAVTGPAMMVAVGYMDPGNGATDLAGGSRYNYTLIRVLLMSNGMAILLHGTTATALRHRIAANVLVVPLDGTERQDEAP